MSRSAKLVIRNIEVKDLDEYYYWNHPSRESHKYNGPYYKTKDEIELKQYIEDLKAKLLQGEQNVLHNKKLIVNQETDEMIGQVNWYWKSEETVWMEIGIVIFNEQYWGTGLGYIALKMWITQLFEEKPELARLGLSTWSGNTRMIKLAEKLNLVKEAVYRKARIVDGCYYDSVSYGILREEWHNL